MNITKKKINKIIFLICLLFIMLIPFTSFAATTVVDNLGRETVGKTYYCSDCGSELTVRCAPGANVIYAHSCTKGNGDLCALGNKPLPSWAVETKPVIKEETTKDDGESHFQEDVKYCDVCGIKLTTVDNTTYTHPANACSAIGSNGGKYFKSDSEYITSTKKEYETNADGLPPSANLNPDKDTINLVMESKSYSDIINHVNETYRLSIDANDSDKADDTLADLFIFGKDGHMGLLDMIRMAGALLLVFGLGKMILAFKDDNANEKSQAMMLIMAAIFCVTISALLTNLGLFS